MKIPVTKEEKAAAARKYGMIEEDYVPYGPDERPGHHNWDIVSMKKDFGEPMDENWNFHQGTRGDTGRKWMSPQMAFLAFLCNVTVFYGLLWISPNTYFPIIGPQLPANGPHYTFERADQE